MLNYSIIKHFFENNPEGCINIVQNDCIFKLKKDITYYLDETSITFLDINYTDKKCGNGYERYGNFMLPFNQIMRIEYIKKYKEY